MNGLSQPVNPYQDLTREELEKRLRGAEMVNTTLKMKVADYDEFLGLIRAVMRIMKDEQ